MEVNQECPLSPILFYIYNDELEAFLREHIQEGIDAFYITSRSPSFFLLMMWSFWLLSMRNCSKTKVMVFNRSTSSLANYHFFFKDNKIEVALHIHIVQCMGPQFNWDEISHPWSTKVMDPFQCLSDSAFKCICKIFHPLSSLECNTTSISRDQAYLHPIGPKSIPWSYVWWKTCAPPEYF